MKIVAADPNVDAFHVVHRRSGPSATLNNGRMFMRLKDRSERKLNAEPDHPGTARETGADSRHRTSIMQNPPLIRVGGMLTKALYQYSLQDTDTKELFRLGADADAENGGDNGRVSGCDQRFANRQPAGQRGD